MREVHTLVNIDKGYNGIEPPDLLSMMMKAVPRIVIRPLDMMKQYDFVVLGIPYKKNRSARLQKKMQKIVGEKTS